MENILYHSIKVSQISQNHVIIDFEVQSETTDRLYAVNVVIDRNLKFIEMNLIPDEEKNLRRKIDKIIGNADGPFIRVAKFIFGYKD